MTHRIQRHNDWRGKDGTAFYISSPAGDWQYIYAGSDHGACHYASITCPQGFTISRWNAAQTIHNARKDGYRVAAVRYVHGLGND